MSASIGSPATDGATRLVGDVDFAAVRQIAGAITPVPGGVGPMTIACLLRNTVLAAYRRRGLPDPTPRRAGNPASTAARSAVSWRLFELADAQIQTFCVTH